MYFGCMTSLVFVFISVTDPFGFIARLIPGFLGDLSFAYANLDNFGGIYRSWAWSESFEIVGVTTVRTCSVWLNDDLFLDGVFWVGAA